MPVRAHSRDSSAQRRLCFDNSSTHLAVTPIARWLPATRLGMTALGVVEARVRWAQT
jgi:hypothetical protein